MKSRLSIALPGVALALFAIAAAQAAPPSPGPPAARATEPVSMSAKHLSEMEVRMKLMQEQMRRIRETKSPAIRAKLLREHMHTMMDQMQAMRAMDGRMVGGGNQTSSSAEQRQWSQGRMRDHMQGRLDMMQLMMEQLMDHMQAMQGMTMGAKGPHR